MQTTPSKKCQRYAGKRGASHVCCNRSFVPQSPPLDYKGNRGSQTIPETGYLPCPRAASLFLQQPLFQMHVSYAGMTGHWTSMPANPMSKVYGDSNLATQLGGRPWAERGQVSLEGALTFTVAAQPLARPSSSSIQLY